MYQFVDNLDYPRISYELHIQRIGLGQPDDDFKPMDLLTLLRWTSDMKATDPKDKLYALLGVDKVRDITVLPNYNDTKSTVYTDFAASYIKTRSTLELLCNAGIGIGDRDPELPSWVPDFSLPEVSQFSAQGNILTSDFNCAAGSHKSDPLINLTHSLLSVKGFIVIPS